MTKFSLKPAYPARYALAIAAGILLALAFPRVSIAGFAWVAPGLLLFAAIGVRPGFAFRIGYIGGFAYYLTTLNWLLYIPVKFFPILGWIALSAYLSLFPALWVWLCWKLFPASVSIATHPWDRTSHRAIFETSWTQRALWTIKCGAVWVALEMILGRFSAVFPGIFSASRNTKCYRSSRLLRSPAFMAFLSSIIWFSVSLLLTALALARIPLSPAVVTRNWVREIIFPLLAIFMVAAYGISTIRGYRAPSETTRVALIQPSIPQTLIWDEGENENRFRQLIALSEQALTNNADILLWPEASVPNMLRHHDATAKRSSSWRRSTKHGRFSEAMMPRCVREGERCATSITTTARFRSVPKVNSPAFTRNGSSSFLGNTRLS